MKLENMGWQQRQKLGKVYDQRHADEIPQPPTFQEIEPQERNLINVGRATDIYIAASLPNPSANYHSEDRVKNGYLRVVAPDEHIDVDIPVGQIDKIIDELVKIKNDIEAHNHAVSKYKATQKAYEEAKASYEDLKELAIQKTFGDGKYTEKQVTHELDNIPF